MLTNPHAADLATRTVAASLRYAVVDISQGVETLALKPVTVARVVDRRTQRIYTRVLGRHCTITPSGILAHNSETGSAFLTPWCTVAGVDSRGVRAF